MIEAKFGLVAGENRKITVDKDWNVVCKDRPIEFSTELGSLVVATVMSNFDTVTTKSDLKNLTNLAYSSLIGKEHGFGKLQKDPKEHTTKEIGDIFDALVRRRTFPLRENVFHIGKLSFRKILFIQYPSDFDLVEKIINNIEISPDFDEDYIRVSYLRTYTDKYKKLQIGTKKEIRKSRASVETLDRLNRNLVEVETRVKRHNETSKNENVNVETISSTNTMKRFTPKPKSAIKELNNRNEFTPQQIYEKDALDYIEKLENGDIFSPKDLKEHLREKGFNPSDVGIDMILLKSAKMAKIKKSIVEKDKTNKKVVYKRFNKQ
jgi:hypothetical protein